MVYLLTTVLISIFLFLSGLHVYWAYGGKWGSGAVLPTKSDDEKIMMPGMVPTLIVAFGLFGFAAIVFLSTFYGLLNYGLWAISFIFILRAIGDFRYLGFFKKYKNTKFAQNDTKIYSPLCLFIGILSFLLKTNL